VIRFRFQEDERRFVKLHAEMFKKLADAGLNDVVGSETLRNVGKIEQMAYMEGVRQGLAMAAIATEMIQREIVAIPEPYAQKAFQLHAMIYGSSDTPLRNVETEWLDKIDLDKEHLAKSWLDDKPMRFAPATLQELDGTEPPIAPMVSVKAAHKPTPVAKPFDPATSPGMTDLMIAPESIEEALERLPPPEAMHGAEVTVPEPWQKGEYEPDDQDDEPDIRMPHLVRAPDDEEIQPESPDFLDRTRDAIQTLKRGGWDPKTWQDLVLGLHRHMHVDAGFLDLQLTTHVGRTVLDQCGLAGMAPPEMMSFEFLNALPGKAAAAPSSMGEPGEGSMGFGKAHGWDDER
jgi:hypothetical protein